MPPRTKTIASSKTVETLTHEEATRKNIPTAEYQSVVDKEQREPVRVAYERNSGGLADEKLDRNADLDPQLVWRGKDQQDWSDLVVQAPPLYIQEKIHPKVLIDDLLRQTKASQPEDDEQYDLFGDFNGLPEDPNAKTEFYQHDAHWSNRMILGDSLQVMASLAEREGLRGKVQCIYFDPPYGIKFNSNFQWSTTSRDVKDGKIDNITREPEQVKAFRDTWRDGIHSYLTYLRDRLTVARDLLTESGSIFVQISDENVHRVRALMDEVFGERGFVSQIAFAKTSGLEASQRLSSGFDYILWYSSKGSNKYRPLLKMKVDLGKGGFNFVERRIGSRVPISTIEELQQTDRPYAISDLTKPGPGSKYVFKFRNCEYTSGNRWWGTTPDSLQRLAWADRFQVSGKNLRFIRYLDDSPTAGLNNNWEDTGIAGFTSDKVYVVQTNARVIERCILMTTDPGDLVLDPTMGSGTTAYVAEQWGRRWITIDTSRVATALARARIMGARYPYYLLTDSPEGQRKEAEITRTEVSTASTRGDIRHGFVYERVPHITLKSIANNAEIDVIWDEFQKTLEPIREKLNKSLGKKWEEWEIPREAESSWSDEAKALHQDWWTNRIARQKEIDASIAARADVEKLYDKPYEDKKKVRVAGPFTVESLSPHRVLTMDENDELVDQVAEKPGSSYGAPQSFEAMILENLKMAGVQQGKKEDKIAFTSLVPWPGITICAEGKYEETEGQVEKRAGIYIGPEFGTVTRMQLVEAAKEAGDAGFDVLISCAFAYDAHSTDLSKIGRIQILKARMNADLHMATDLKNTGKGNLFVIFGEPDIRKDTTEDGQVIVEIRGVDVFKPSTGKVESSEPDDIACWFIDTNYNEESFFVRQAYFGGTAQDPYKGLKTALKAEINPEAWDSIYSTKSRPFPKPQTGKIAVKVINHLGDEVMKVFRV